MAVFAWRMARLGVSIAQQLEGGRVEKTRRVWPGETSGLFDHPAGVLLEFAPTVR